MVLDRAQLTGAQYRFTTLEVAAETGIGYSTLQTWLTQIHLENGR